MAYDTEGLAKLQHLKQLAELLKGEFATEDEMQATNQEIRNEMLARYEVLTTSVDARIEGLELQIQEIWNALS